MTQFTTWDILRNLLSAAEWTLVLSLVAFIGGAALGLTVLMLRVGKSRIARRIAIGYVEIGQGTPLLMQMFLAFFGLALLGLDVPAWLAATAALIFWTSAFLAEIWRGCVESLPKGQWEASASLGLRFHQQMRLIILPQALRIAIPPTVGFVVQVVKGTALASIVGFQELSKVGVAIANATFAPATVYGFVALIYFCINWPISRASQTLERKLHVGR